MLASGRALNQWSWVQYFNSSLYWKTADNWCFILLRNKIPSPIRTILCFLQCKLMPVGPFQNGIIAKFHRTLAQIQRFESSRNCKTAGKRCFILCGNKITIPNKDYLMFPILSIVACRYQKICMIKSYIGRWPAEEDWTSDPEFNVSNLVPTGKLQRKGTLYWASTKSSSPYRAASCFLYCQFLLVRTILNWIIAKFQRALASGRAFNRWSWIKGLNPVKTKRTAGKRCFILCGNKIIIPLKGHLIFPLKSIVTHWTISELHDCKVSKGLGQQKSIQLVIMNQRFESSKN
jgi:hypothetical protein